MVDGSLFCVLFISHKMGVPLCAGVLCSNIFSISFSGPACACCVPAAPMVTAITPNARNAFCTFCNCECVVPVPIALIVNDGSFV